MQNNIYIKAGEKTDKNKGIRNYKQNLFAASPSWCPVKASRLRDEVFFSSMFSLLNSIPP